MHARYLRVSFSFCLEMSHAALTVGTCQSDKHPYATISAAIAAAPAGGVVKVCPGTYAEQLEIDKPLTIQGIVMANQPGISVVSPTTGLKQLPANSSSYPQVFVNNAGGPVNLSNLSVSGAGASIIDFNNLLQNNLGAVCVDGELQDFSGVYFLNTPGVLDHMNVSSHFGSRLSPGDEGLQDLPNCGNGVEFNGSEKAVVRNSVVSNVGLYGIYSSGDLTADHNVVSAGFGPYGAGIRAEETIGTITDNTITGTLFFIETMGIEGGQLVRGNTVQSSLYGIVGAATARHNTLLNNAIGMSTVTDASDNLITAPSTYQDPACVNGNCPYSPDLNPTPPTIGIDLGCADGSLVRDNGIVGVGIGIANVELGQTFSPTNLFANVTTTSTSCTQ